MTVIQTHEQGRKISMKATRFLIPATLAMTMGGGMIVAPAAAQPAEREGFNMFGPEERGWFGGRPEVFGEGRRGWFEDRERETRDRFDRGYRQGRMDERRDRMRREGRRNYGENERNNGWFGGDGLFD
jgi:hypothetical protein